MQSRINFVTYRQVILLFVDVTPPSVQGCPASFTEQTDTIFKEVTWKEPTFTDNVGVASVLSNRKPNFDMGAFSTLTIIYVATDAAGNEANCKFDITVEGKKCCKHILSFCTIHHFIYLHCFVVFLFSIDTPIDKLAHLP